MQHWLCTFCTVQISVRVNMEIDPPGARVVEGAAQDRCAWGRVAGASMLRHVDGGVAVAVVVAWLLATSTRTREAGGEEEGNGDACAEAACWEEVARR